MRHAAAAILLAAALAIVAGCGISAQELDALEAAHAEADARLAAVEDALTVLRENEARRAALLDRIAESLRISAEALDRAIRRLGGDRGY